jgi:parallel beta-helix repeat protein
MVGDTFALIGSITNDTSLELATAYRGEAISGQSMKGQSMLVGVGIENCAFVGATGAALALTQCFRAVFQIVAVQLSGAAVPAWDMLDCGSIVLQGCASENNGDIGVRALESNNLLYIGSMFKNNGSHGIVYTGCQATVLDGSVSTQNNADGIFVGAQSERIQLLDCIISYNNGIGMETSPGSNGAIIANSTFRNNGSDGINFDGAADIVEGCLIQNNGGMGISAGDDGVISDCNIFDNGDDGIGMQQDENCAVTTCVIRGNDGHGILGGADSTLTGNTISNNTGDGINIPNAADDCVVTGNRVFGNAGDGIVIGNAAARCTLLGNNFNGNTGASITDNSATTIKDTGDAAGDYNQT